MRRLLVLISVVVFVDTMLFGVMVPLLPAFADAYGLGKLQAGLLFGSYGAGAVLGGVPGGILAARVGPKRAVLAGLLLLALASFAFAAAGSPAALGVARFVQGFSSTLTWAGALAWVVAEVPRSRRGEMLGIVFGAAVAGAISGPMFGALARAASIEVSFAIVGLVGLALAAAAAFHPPAPREPIALGRLAAAGRDRAFLLGLWLNLLGALFFGVLDVLVPLALHDAGYGAFAIGALFVVAGLAEIAVGPITGRLSDRRGPTFPVRIALVCGLSTAVVLAVITAPAAVFVAGFAGAVSFAALYAPGMTLVSDRAEASGLAMALGFGVMNSAWALGVVVGPIVGGALAGAFSDAVPYLACAAVAGLTLAVVTRRPVAAPQPSARASSSDGGNRSSAQPASSRRRR